MRLEPVVKFSATMRPVQIGATPIGTRLNLELDGRSEEGGRIAGRFTGVDYATLRSDGNLELNVQATLTSEGGERAAISGIGLAVPTPGGGMAGRLALRFATAAPGLAWMNSVLGIAVTRADMQTGSLEMTVHTLED